MFVGKKGFLITGNVQVRSFFTSRLLASTHIVKIESPLGIGSGTIARSLAKKVNYQYIPVLEIMKAIVFKATNKSPTYKQIMNPERLLNFIKNSEVECIYDPKLDYKIFVNSDDLTTAALGLKNLSVLTKRLQENPSVQRELLNRVTRVICEHEAQGVIFSTYMTRLQTPCDISIFLQADLETRVKLEMRRARGKNLDITPTKVRQSLLHHDEISRVASKIHESTHILDVTKMKLAHIVHTCENIIKASKD